MNMPLQNKIKNIDKTIKEIIRSDDINKIKEGQETLIPYTNMLTEATQELRYCILNGYEGRYIRKQAITENREVPETEEAQYTESIAKLFSAKGVLQKFKNYN